MVRIIFLACVLCTLLGNYILSFFLPFIWWDMVFFGPIILIGFVDMLQNKKAVRKNFPVLGNFRYLMEAIRPEINQYFVESNSSGRPFSREERSLVYQRAKNVRDTLPFGTQRDVYELGYEWANHSMTPVKTNPDDMRVTIGGDQCKHPYSASILNISAMSYGALSKTAIASLNEGAKLGNFAHNTGEGGISPYHLHGGDLIWQIGTGYFGCRASDGSFCEKKFADKASMKEVKMIELKLSQGAKPGGGGIVPGAKVTQEIADIRGVPIGKAVISPSKHSTFDNPTGLMEFIAKLRDLSDGKPVGIKFCVGRRREFIAVCKAMRKTGIMPDYISVDGSEGGTGAAPLEFANNLGCPLTEGLIFVHNCLNGFALREKIKIIASGKVTTGFGMVHRLAIGADIIYSARGFMMSLGCIQALKCDSNHCPVGVATQDPGLVVGLVVKDKNKRVCEFHKQTIKSMSQLIGAMGLNHTLELRPWHIMRRMNATKIHNYTEIHEYLKKGELIAVPVPESFQRAWDLASENTFSSVKR